MSDSAADNTPLTNKLAQTTPTSPPTAASLRLEVFVLDLDTFLDFYTRVLGFTVSVDRRADATPYLAVSRENIRIGASRPWAPVNPESRTVPNGVEIVLEVNDLDADYRRVIDSGWPLAHDKQRRSWGLTDFRLHDPDGYYIRVTNR
jgi:lactoylglutathione lyase